MFAKLRSTFFAILIGLPGVWGVVSCARALVEHVVESERMGDWVLAKATVQAPLFEGYQREYRYRFAERDYVGTQLGVGGEGRMSFGDWLDEMVGFLDVARQKGKQVSVYVNPDNPAQSVVDRDVRASYVVGMSLFFVFCASFALGAIFWISYTWFLHRSPKAKAWREAAFLWAFGLFWSLFSFAIAFAAVPDALAQGEYAVLLVLLFPLVGVLVLFGALKSTFALLPGRK